MTQTFAELYDAVATGNQPQEVGLGGFKLYASLTTQIEYDTDAPISYLEDGASVTDHLVLKPLVITISAAVGDIYLGTGTASGVKNLVRRTQGQIGVFNQFLPPKSQATQQRINSLINDVDDAYNFVDSVTSQGEQLFDFFGDKTQTTTQNSFFNFIEKTRGSKILIDVQTRYRTYNSMAIVSITPAYDNQNYATAFTVRLQEVRFAKITQSDASTASKNPAKNVGGDTGSEQNEGTQQGSKIDNTSALYSLAKGLGGV